MECWPQNFTKVALIEEIQELRKKLRAALSGSLPTQPENNWQPCKECHKPHNPLANCGSLPSPAPPNPTLAEINLVDEVSTALGTRAKVDVIRAYIAAFSGPSLPSEGTRQDEICPDCQGVHAPKINMSFVKRGAVSPAEGPTPQPFERNLEKMTPSEAYLAGLDDARAQAAYASAPKPSPRCPKCRGNNLPIEHIDELGCDGVICKSCGANFNIASAADFAQFFTPSAREKHITLGMQVFVDNPQFTGYGIAQYDTGDRKRCIGVLLENGHTWEYDIATVRNAELDELPKMPRAIREYKRPSAGEPTNG